jgi:peptide deformylase
MAIRRIWVIDNPVENRVLRTKAKKVSRFDAHLQKLVDDMWETMRVAPGVGLAAPQIGESIRVLVAEFEEEHVALVNPEILKKSEELLYGTEGCLSIPGLVGDDVPRASTVTVKGRDPHGKEIRVKAAGWFARVLQHEIDHLDGVLYTDHISREKVRAVTPEEQVEEGEVEQVVTVKSGKNGKTETVKRPEREERRAPGPSTRAATGRPAAARSTGTATAPTTTAPTAATPSTPSHTGRRAGERPGGAEQ